MTTARIRNAAFLVGFAIAALAPVAAFADKDHHDSHGRRGRDRHESREHRKDRDRDRDWERVRYDSHRDGRAYCAPPVRYEPVRYVRPVRYVQPVRYYEPVRYYQPVCQPVVVPVCEPVYDPICHSNFASVALYVEHARVHGSIGIVWP
jgi:hypothetical protein